MSVRFLGNKGHYIVPTKEAHTPVTLTDSMSDRSLKWMTTSESVH